MNNNILIKKYANRRLYDTSSSRYIILSDIPAMIEGGKTITVIDAKTGDDITRSVLMQLIVEKESTDAEALFPTGFWMKSVRLYNSSMGNMFADHISNILNTFIEHQAVIEAQTQEMFSGLASNPFVDLAEKNITVWRKMLEGMAGASQELEPTEQLDQTGDLTEELMDIKIQIAELARQLNQLQDAEE